MPPRDPACFPILHRLLLAVLTALTVLATGLALVGPATAAPPAPPSPTESHRQLDQLRVAAPGSSSGYSRDRFPHWRAVSGTCNAREMVLRRDGVGVTVGGDCQPTAGWWFSVYDQVTLTRSADVSIDHMVPLANAWRSGARNWTEARRADFANDLARGQLIAVTIASNSAKGDRSPDQWRPGNRGYWCDYARHWTDVKFDWGLTVTSAEKTALRDMLTTC